MAILSLSRRLGQGGTGLFTGGAGLRDNIRKLLAALASASGATAAPAWDTAIAVTTDTVTLPTPGRVLAVEATTATSAGPKAQIQSGTPAAGAVDVQYDAAGIATLTFNGTDAVTVCAVSKLGFGDSITIE